jgi:hypothetical protein
MVDRAVERRPHLKRWTDEMPARPGVHRGMNVMRKKVRAEIVEDGMDGINAEHRSTFLGARQHEERPGSFSVI